MLLFQGAWWEVDLGSALAFSKVIIYNRQDCCQDRLSWSTISLIDGNDMIVGTYILGDTSNSLKVEIDVSAFAFPVNSYAVPSVSPTPAPTTPFPTATPSESPSISLSPTLPTVLARYVKIQHDSSTAKIMSLGEVEVYNGSNQALDKIATQSSTGGSSWASEALDGNIMSYSETTREAGKCRYLHFHFSIVCNLTAAPDCFFYRIVVAS